MKMDVKKYVLTISTTMIFVATFILMCFSMFSLKNTIFRDYETIAKTATTHVIAQIEGTQNRSGKWSYDETTQTLYYGDMVVDDAGFQSIQKFDSDIHHTLFWGNTRVVSDMTDENGNSIIGTTCDEEIYNIVKENGLYTANNVNISGNRYTVCYVGIYNGEEIVGMSFCGVMQTAANSELMYTFIKLMLIIVASVLVAVFINIRLVTKKLTNANSKLVGCMDSLNTTGQNVSDMSHNVSMFSNQILAATEEVSKATTDQAACTQEAMAGVEEFGSSVNVIIDNINIGIEHSTLMKNNLTKTQDAISDFKEGTKTNTSKIEEVRHGIEANKYEVENIAKAITDIDSIAFQITILALNAQVEAAHAGDLGKGFAVVADSIKNLSEKTTESSQVINAAINQAIQKANEAIGMVNDLVEFNNENVEKLESTMKLFDELTESIDSVNNNLDEINTQAELTTTVKNQIVDVIQSLAASSEENAAISEEMQSSVTQIDQKILELGDKIDSLKDVEDTLSDVKQYFIKQ